MTKTLHIGSMIALLGLMALGCSGDDDDEPVAPAKLEVIGEYDEYFDGNVVSELVVTETAWNSSAIVEYDNAKNVVYTQAPDDDAFNPNKFGKIVYTEPADGSFYYCSVEFSLDTLEDAKDSTTEADDSDPETGGCDATNDFPWSKVTEK